MSYSIEAWDTYTVYCETVRKARKAHKCSACRVVIRPGDYYCNVALVHDKKAKSLKRCGACQLTHLHLRERCAAKGYSSNYERMWPDERLGCGLDYEEEWGEEPPDEIWRLPLLGPDERGALLAPKEAA